MAALRFRRLKVFQAQFGFHDSVVASPSQPAALRAWGTHQNLFAEGSAKVATDEAAIAAALAHPERPLRRAVGSTDPFQLVPTGLPRIPDAPKRTREPSATSQAKGKPRTRPPADRSHLDAAERALSTLNAEGERQEAALLAQLRDLEAEIAAARSRWRDRRKAAEATVAAARQSYRKAGGTP